MPELKTEAIKTIYGIIYSRDALIITDIVMSPTPLEITIKTSLSLSCCIPRIAERTDIRAEFKFYEITSISIYRIDDYPYEKYSSSSFDEVSDECASGVKTYILSTYDHVFYVIGKCNVTFAA
ncbi:hypothetical protein Q7O56_30050 [Pseudomonas protegens]|uniref:Uncharacterized protein n=1 Tax=Pseudomonas idahonensis TaxID=2942628 RepID=A0ABT5QC03_9PSED|nr:MULTISPECIES: hypothetical protein [Pseudomonas]KAF0866036.1 hypothetical protein PLD_12465 [Pseudomonas sp. LD120]MDD1151744.1 hypothetical protein [Pseudomonas idahonensis]MDP9513280.1 hypothetical protein [Pseudomonas protegens]